MLYQFVCDYAIVNSSYSTNEPFQQKILWLILDHCDDSQVRSLFETVLTHNLPISGHTLLQFAQRFMSLGQAHVGFEIIRNTLRLGADPSSYEIQSSCVKLLRIRPEQDDWYDYQNTVVAELLQLGVRPNVILWNCIMQNAIEAGRYETAWRWYDMGINDGLKPTRPTIFILLKIVKDQKNEDLLRSVIDEAHKTGVLPNDLEVVYDLLHAVLVIGQQKGDSGGLGDENFQNCLRYYVQYCDIGPLQELGCRLGPVSEWQSCDRQLPAPTPNIIGIMVMAYLGGHGPWEHAIDLWIRYDSLVTSKHPLIAPLANTDHVSNAFLMRFGNHKHTLHYCTAVISSMIKSTPSETSRSRTMRSTTPNQTGQPTLQTWNILQRAYMKHQLTEAAEKVVSMLRKRGFIPDRVTWTQLISLYLNRQQTYKVVYAAKAMKDSGIEYDDVTIRTLQRIADKPRFFKAMDEADRRLQVVYGGDRSSQSQMENPSREDTLEKSSSEPTDEEVALKHKPPSDSEFWGQ
ncbi:MAG: hypothetical protein Q9195_000517 [Heterodermia aff. obscurata]